MREALARYMKDLKKCQRKTQMAQKAAELVSIYESDVELTEFVDLDSEAFL